MPVEFLTDDEEAAYGRFVGPPSRADLERVFFLDDEDRALVGRRRGQHMKLGFALQLVTARWLGTFLEGPLDVPGVVLEFVAEQLEVEDPSQVKRYTERQKTPFDHQWEIRRVYGWKDFASVEAEFVAWVAARSWTSGDGPKAIFTDGVGWLRERKVLLPGATTLARLVAKVRDDATKRLWGVLEGMPTIGQRYVLDQLLDLLMATELVNKAQNTSNKEKVRKHPKLAKSAARLAVAVEALFESDGWGGEDEEVRVAEVWEAIENVVSRAELRAALVLVNENVPPADAADPDDWRKELLSRYTTVSGFAKLLPEVIEFGANAEGAKVLAAMQGLPDVLAFRSRLAAPLIPGRLVDAEVVNGPWKRLVFGHPAHEGGAVNRHAYAFCVLEQFWRALKRREIYAEDSTKWRNPQAELLEGDRWEAIRPDVLTALSLPDNPDALLADHARTLDAAYKEVGGRLIANPDVRVDASGKIHLMSIG